MDFLAHWGRAYVVASRYRAGASFRWYTEPVRPTSLDQVSLERRIDKVAPRCNPSKVVPSEMAFSGDLDAGAASALLVAGPRNPLIGTPTPARRAAGPAPGPAPSAPARARRTPRTWE